MMNTPLLHRLLLRGDKISIQNGRLIILPRSGNAVPDEWFNKNRTELFVQISKLIQIEMFIFDGYSTGLYKVDGTITKSGITLKFINTLTGELAYSNFNVNLLRKKTTGQHKKGSRLPKKNFTVTKNHGFYKWYLSTDLPMPRRITCFNEVINKLKQITFFGEVGARGKIINKLMLPVNISHEEILSALPHNIANKTSTNHQQMVTKTPTNNFNKDLSLGCESKGLHQNQSACADKCDTSLQGRTNKGLTITAISNITSTTLALPSNNQTGEYQKLPPSPLKVSESKRVQDQSYEEWTNEWNNGRVL